MEAFGILEQSPLSGLRPSSCLVQYLLFTFGYFGMGGLLCWRSAIRCLFDCFGFGTHHSLLLWGLGSCQFDTCTRTRQARTQDSVLKAYLPLMISIAGLSLPHRFLVKWSGPGNPNK